MPIELTDGEREQLEAWARRRRSAAGLAQRSRIVLACAKGATNTAVARQVGVSVPTVRRWRGRFSEQRLDGLLDEPRPGRPRTISDQAVEDVIVKTLETVPPDGRDALVHAPDGRRERSKPDGGLADLAGVLRYSPTVSSISSCLRIRCSSRRSKTLSGSTWTRPSARSCSASMRRHQRSRQLRV